MAIDDGPGDGTTRHLGFVLSWKTVAAHWAFPCADGLNHAPHDSRPEPAECDLCHRYHDWCWRLWDERRMCDTCLEDSIRVKTRRRYFAHRRGLAEVPSESLPKDDPDLRRFDNGFWDERFER